MSKIKISALLFFCVFLFFVYGSSNIEAADTNYTEKVEQVEHNWGKGGPENLIDHFSATFDQAQYLKVGDYFIQTLADDGVSVDVNSTRLIDRLHYTPTLVDWTYFTNMKEGFQNITTNYQEGTGNAVIFSHVVPFDSWLAYYYANPSFLGTPVGAKIIEPKDHGGLVDTNWLNSPLPNKIPVDHFSAIYYTAKRLEAGEYVIRTGADDGAQVYLDGKLVLDRFTPIGYREDAVKVSIKDSSEYHDIHRLEVRYKEGILSSRVNVSIQPYEEVMKPTFEDGWVGEVFPSADFSGKPIILGGKGANQPLETLDLNWLEGSPSPFIPADSFSGRFYKQVDLDETGIYTLKVWADDKVKLYVDGKRMIDSWKYIPGSYREKTIPLEKGKHDIKIEYQEATENARLKFDIEKNHIDYTKVEAAPHYSWGLDSPVGKADYFTAQFDQSQYLYGGDYFVQTMADDGLFVDFDGKGIINRWDYSPEIINRALLTGVSEGNHEMNTLYREGIKTAALYSDIVPFGDWLAYYYGNEDFAGMPKAVKTIKSSADNNLSLSETNGQESPVPSVIPNDHFTAKYVTAKRIKEGDYVLRTGADDGLQVYIDGKMVLDRFTPVGYREDAVKVSIHNTSGTGDIHWVEVKYKEGILSSKMNVSLQPYTVVNDPSEEDGWTGELYSNVNLTGNPVILGGKGASTLIKDLDFNWGNHSPSPLIPEDNYSARFTRKVTIHDPGYYVVKANADDGVRVFIDGKQVIDSWKYQAELERKAGVELTAGIHSIKVEYYDGKIGSKLKFDLAKGKTTFSKAEKALRYNWGFGSPDIEVQPDHFTATFDQSQYLAAGDYFIQTLADDGVQVDVNGRRVIDRNSYSFDSITDRALLTNIPEGNQEITTHYYEGTSNAVLFSEIVKFGDWLAYYYPNETLSGTPIAAKVEKAGSSYGRLSENLGYNSPIPGTIKADHFSAKYVTAKRVPAGDYVLRTGADDGVQVYIDGKLVLNRFTNGGFREDSIKLKINDNGTADDKDIHWIEVRYKEASQSARVEVFLQPYSDAVNISSTDGWLGEFYKNTSLSGDSVIEGGKNALKPISSLNFNWGNDAPTPLVPSDYFSARFTKKVNIATTGDYAITVYADDGVRVRVDGSTKIDSWEYVSGNKRQIVLKDLMAGIHTIVVEYFDGKLAASIKYDLQQVLSDSYLDLDLRKPANITAQDIIDFFNRKKPNSILKNYAQDFIDVQKESGVNAQYLVAHSIWETGWGTSTLSIYKRNFFGYGAYDSCPFTCAYYFPTGHDTISYVAYQVKTDYLTPGTIYDNGPNLVGMNVKYASDQNWKNGIASLMQSIKPYDPVYYDKVKPSTIVPKTPTSYSRNIPAGEPVPKNIVINFPAGIKATVNNGVNFRTLPYASNSTYIRYLSASTKVEVIGYNTDVKSNWYRAKVDGTSGWVSGNYLTIQNLLQVSAGTTLNIRKDATTSSDIVKTVQDMTYLKTVLDSNGKKITKNGWYQVYVPGSTQTGWASGSYLKIIE
ncbi:glucosaminidase domain-containing protein [Neobacillus cucumis]|uniref:PA14 domain-containing protein n=1 Tax=Neobacillus cucumis TaxID=1740721 RepID=UPI0018DF8DBA|nr:PA14 domain-containing protein [Neobacillus cucumis]MBI0577731.1 glucosaminidase domain-containing protein [Neobacillus cucumis]